MPPMKQNPHSIKNMFQMIAANWLPYSCTLQISLIWYDHVSEKDQSQIIKPIETKKKWDEVAKLRYTEIKKQNFNYSKERGRVEERHELRPSKNDISIL
jgi:hypothetical protein